MLTDHIQQAVTALQQGEIIAYPTEAVFGLGCDPFNEAAVRRLLALKHRADHKGLIVIAQCWDQLAPLTAAVPQEALEQAQKTWPGPVTWVFPAATGAPRWITGQHRSIALRVTAHPIASALCAAFGGPIVSTSANVEGAAPARDPDTVHQYFETGLALVLRGPLGESSKPTTIRDIMTGETLRY
jgi:L-threonylcarbamoyladenylate synthase